MKTGNDLMGVNARLISAQKEVLAAYDSVETDDFRLAWREFTIANSLLNEAQRSGDPSAKDREAPRYLNAQRAFIRAQVDLMHRNNVYGDKLWQQKRRSSLP